MWKKQQISSLEEVPNRMSLSLSTLCACQSMISHPSQKVSHCPKHSTFELQSCLSPSLGWDQMDYTFLTPSQSCCLEQSWFWSGDKVYSTLQMVQHPQGMSVNLWRQETALSK